MVFVLGVIFYVTTELVVLNFFRQPETLVKSILFFRLFSFPCVTLFMSVLYTDYFLSLMFLGSFESVFFFFRLSLPVLYTGLCSGCFFLPNGYSCPLSLHKHFQMF